MGNLISVLFRKLFEKEATIVLIGLDGSGKTTCLYRISRKDDKIVTIPTIGFNIETFKFGNIEMNAWDLGGETRIRNLWPNYYPGADALIVMIDSNDKERFDELKGFLETHLRSKHLREDIKVLFFANKQDLGGSASVIEITRILCLEKIVPKSFDWFIQPCSATGGEGIVEGFEWLSKKL